MPASDAVDRANRCRGSGIARTVGCPPRNVWPAAAVLLCRSLPRLSGCARVPYVLVEADRGRAPRSNAHLFTHLLNGLWKRFRLRLLRGSALSDDYQRVK